jgi:uncharacterized membrane protein
MVWFWCFLVYSFVGFLLEVAFARATGGWADRKCLLVLPLCPVYGLGACAILLLPGWIAHRPVLLFFCAALIATAVEYGMAVFYEELLGVSFWDYLGLPGNLQGRVCLPFSLAWGALALPLVYWLHPALSPLWSHLPTPVSILAALTLLADLVLSTILLKRTGNRDCLKWYAARP